jgi:dephospho-CoA kinase
MNVASARHAFAIALTGGIASGKSATADRFARLGVPVFDADVIARELVVPGQPALAEIAAAFGAQMLTAAGELDRARLRARVFADAAARQRLEAILHPRIRAELLAHAQACTAAYCILAIPLLVECRADYAWVNRVLVADVPPALQLQRLLHRPGIDRITAERMLGAQAPHEQRLAMANDIIDNTGPLTALDAVVARLHRLYLARTNAQAANTAAST